MRALWNEDATVILRKPNRVLIAPCRWTGIPAMRARRRREALAG